MAIYCHPNDSLESVVHVAEFSPVMGREERVLMTAYWEGTENKPQQKKTEKLSRKKKTVAEPCPEIVFPLLVESNITRIVFTI